MNDLAGVKLFLRRYIVSKTNIKLERLLDNN